MGNKVAASCGATANDLASQISRTPATYKPIVSLSVISDRKFEFKHLQELQASEVQYACATALKLANSGKNRYSGVYAVEESRVRLTSSSGDDDYINANYVDGIHQNSEKCYIATQAPLPHTFNDFWQMIWDENVFILVMLTRLVENLKPKADKYWPTSRSPKTYGDITVKLEKIEKSRFQYKIKQFTVTRGSESRTIKQFHFLAWPDHGVPSSPIPLLHMLQAVDLEHEAVLANLKAASPDSAQPRSPILVHCSAGIGRTGTFIIIHTVLKKLREEGKSVNDVNMKNLVARIRQQRAGCLTQACQYLFCYEAVDTALNLSASLSSSLDELNWSPDEYPTDEDDNASDGEDWYWETTRNDPRLAWRHQSQVFSVSDYSSDSEYCTHAGPASLARTYCGCGSSDSSFLRTSSSSSLLNGYSDSSYSSSSGSIIADDV